ncbi:nicotinamide-nucleotide amidohydrolase family protein [Mycoplasma iguanae]|uniref:Nicotinamide-nucleotide amidohydrolase family protein n=1 Tax=Mycoplasma iguanae TaxID=292461 RepID=A0ABY5R7I0_9MOLU|nr:nicotinamide-nucleotide amidohydrolase family protein [Mycoplasma iguanae]UVD81458.1 nicotinamide-nucleotide amidohydrolase family protein [Mycoplasma iguanae]
MEIKMTKTKTFASVESFTGGGFSYKITREPGASQYFKGSIVTYSNDIKEKMGINTSQGVINSQTAKEMALQGKKYFNVDYCFSFTGNAGPTVLDNEPVGLVYIAINDQVFKKQYKGNRKEIQTKAINFAYKKFLELSNK